MKRSMYLWLMIVVLAVAALACGGGSNSGDSGNTGSDSGSGSDSGGDVKMVRDFPVLDDAYEVIDSETAGIVAIVYKTKSSVSDAAAFYRDQMDSMGHTLETDTSANGAAALTFDGNKITVGIAPDPLNSGATVVTIGKTP